MDIDVRAAACRSGVLVAGPTRRAQAASRTTTAQSARAEVLPAADGGRSYSPAFVGGTRKEVKVESPGEGGPVKRKPASGATKRARRVAKGLPARSEREVATERRRLKLQWEEFSQRIAALKIERGCADCGYRAHPAALEFDHLPGAKKRGIISRLSRSPWESVLKEIANCEVVCANCHVIRTVNRWKDGTVEHPGAIRIGHERRPSDRI